MPLPVPLTQPQLESLATTFGTPFQLYDEEAIRENATSLLTAFRSHFPTFEQFFAVKALPNPAILRILLEEGCGLDCSSAAELEVARRLGVPGSKTLFTSNYTSQKDLETAFDQGAILNLDDVSLVASMVKARGRMPELISFRLNPGLGRTDSETASNVLGGPSAKFGVPPDQIVEAYRLAKEHGSTRFGMHMMTGSCVLLDDYWCETVTVLVQTAAKIERELGITFEFLNLGGGLGIPYKPEDHHKTVDVHALAARLKGVVDRVSAAEGLRSRPAICMENGRFMVGPFGWLVARCEAVKKAFAHTYYGLDACMTHLMRPGMYQAYHHITVPSRERYVGASAGDDKTVPRHNAHVVGQLCENNDYFAKDRSLPASAAVGDLFVIHDTGAHSHSMGFNYNNKMKAPELLIRKAPTAAGASLGPVPRVDLIRERETFEDLFGNCVLPEDMRRAIGKECAANKKEAKQQHQQQQAKKGTATTARAASLEVFVGRKGRRASGSGAGLAAALQWVAGYAVVAAAGVAVGVITRMALASKK